MSKVDFVCDYCKKTSNKRKEHIHSDLRNFCSLSCSANARNQDKKNEYIKRWLEGKENGSRGKCGALSYHIIHWLKEVRGEKCEICGWNKTNEKSGLIPVAIHHIDGDHKNNKPENLIILCPNCHSLTFTYGSLNYGNGRKSRRKTL